MLKTFTLKELVKKYGSDAQKQALKKNGNLSGKETEIIMKSVMEYWESCTSAGRGSKRVFTCVGKRSKKADRIDRRSNNGSGQLVGESELKSIVLSFLVQQHNTIKPMSANKWLSSIGIIDETLLKMVYGTKESDLHKIKEYFKKNIYNYENDKLENEMVDDFIQVFLGNLKSNLVSVFRKLNKEGVIVYQKQRWGHTVNDIHRRLKKDEVIKIDTIRQELLYLYNISAQDVFVKKDKKEVKAYNQDLVKELKDQLGLKYYYDAHYCSINNKGMNLIEFLDQKQEKEDSPFFHRLTGIYFDIELEKYKELYSERSLSLAKKREESTVKNYSKFSRVNFLKLNKQYALMWECLLKYFGCYNVLKSSRNVLEKEKSMNPKISVVTQRGSSIHENLVYESEEITKVPEEIEEMITIEIGEMKIDVPKNRPKIDPLAQFKAIRAKTEERKNIINKTHLSYSIAE
ncbi:hypothetical protein [Exiguobacterium sp. s39]|uniref:hypothetical protein n=1 Tax=Exiguobacterium sp. s39 TaxID=2751198 RepID=UPI001BE8E0FD|nr:hypothetical protein [Exiguobacterium sp. s39]